MEENNQLLANVILVTVFPAGIGLLNITDWDVVPAKWYPNEEALSSRCECIQSQIDASPDMSSGIVCL